MLKRILRRQSPPEGEQEIQPEEFTGMPVMTEADPVVPDDVIPMQTVIRWRLLFGVVLVAAAVVLLVGNVTDSIPADLLARWPWVFIIAGALWLLVGLVTGWVHGTLGGPLVVAIGLVAVLGQQDVVLNLMLVSGAVLIALGAGVIVRGVTMPRT